MAVTISGSDGITGDLTSIQLGNGTQSAPAVTGQNTDTGIFFGTNEIKASTGGTEAIVVDSSQRVGIGTSSPSQKLQVNGAVLANNYRLPDTGGTISGSRTTTGAAIQLFDTAQRINFTTAGSERMRINSSGNVGIGTSNPASLLHVDTGAGNFQVSNFGTSSVNIQNSVGVGVIRYIAGGGHRFSSNDSTELVRITGAGNVGIGTSSPDAKLKIQAANSDTPASSFAIRQNNAADSAQTTFSVEASPTDGVSRLIGSATSDPKLAFYTGGSEAVRIDESGDVGIGTSNPGSKLDVVGSASATNFLGRAGTTAMTIGIPNTNTALILYGSGFTSDPNRILFRTGNTVRGEIDAVGRVVMGGISPGTSVSYSFCTSGRLQTIASYTNTTGSGANMHIASNGLVIRSTSSIRYKTDIETLEDSYADKLLECRPVWYRSTATDDTAHPEWGYYGFIAEEVADVDPRLVHFDEQEDGTLQPEGVQYTQMTAHLVNIVKRQKQAIETLETKVAALEAAE